KSGHRVDAGLKGRWKMNKETWILVGIFCVVVVAMLGFAVVGLPTTYGTAGSAYPPTIGGQ
ncbi:MAG: hypothetical protein ACREIB_12985, partial [Pseudomonadota bacterium]